MKNINDVAGGCAKSAGLDTHGQTCYNSVPLKKRAESDPPDARRGGGAFLMSQ